MTDNLVEQIRDFQEYLDTYLKDVPLREKEKRLKVLAYLEEVRLEFNEMFKEHSQKEYPGKIGFNPIALSNSKAVASALGWTEDRARDVLDRCMDSGLLKRIEVKTGRPNRPYRSYAFDDKFYGNYLDSCIHTYRRPAEYGIDMIVIRKEECNRQ